MKECPRCESPSYNSAWGDDNFTIPIMMCDDCGYEEKINYIAVAGERIIEQLVHRGQGILVERLIKLVEDNKDEAQEILTKLKEENKKLKAIVNDVVELHRKNYGNGVATHLGLIDLAKEARSVLKELK